MPFPRRLLTEGEDVVVELRPHWVVLGWPLVVTVLAAAGALAIVVVAGSVPSWVGAALGAAVGVPALWLAGRVLRWRTTTVVLTTTRILQRSGVLARRSLEIRLDRVNELSSRQTLLGRLLGEGEVLVETGGEAGVVVFDRLPHPAAVQSVISGQVAAFHRARAAPPSGVPGVTPVAPGAPTPPAGVPPVGPAGGRSPGPASAGAAASVAERLVQLDDLYRRGIVSAEEYRAKKAELLRQL